LDRIPIRHFIPVIENNEILTKDTKMRSEMGLFGRGVVCISLIVREVYWYCKEENKKKSVANATDFLQINYVISIFRYTPIEL